MIGSLGEFRTVGEEDGMEVGDFEMASEGKSQFHRVDVRLRSNQGQF